MKKMKTALLWVTMLTTISNILGFVRESGIAYVFGASEITDAYYLSSILPDVFASWVATALTVAVLPLYKEYQRSSDASSTENHGLTFAHTLLTTITMLMTLVALLTMATAPLLLRMLAPGFSSSGLHLAVNLYYCTAPAILFTGVLGAVTAFLNAHNRFLSTASIGIIQNLVILVGIAVVARTHNVFHLAYFYTGAMAMRLLLQLPELYSIRILKFPWTISWKHPGLMRLLRSLGPVVLGTLASNVSFVIDRILASGLPPGSISALSFANKVIGIPQQLFAISLATVLFPRLSEAHLNKDTASFAHQMCRGLGLLFFALVPLSVYIAVFREPIIRLLFQRGAFTAYDTHNTSQILGILSFGLVLVSMAVLMIRGFYARQENHIPAAVGFFAVLTNLVFGLILSRSYQAYGIAASNVISYLTYTLVLALLMFRRVKNEFQWNHLWGGLSLVPTLLSVMPLSVGWLVLHRFVPPPSHTGALVLWLTLMALAGLGIYMGMSSLFRSPFTAQLTAFLQSKARKKGIHHREGS